MTRGWLGWGMAAVALYVTVVSLLSPHFPVRLLYDGEAPPAPYRWVQPPATIPGPHQPPQLGSGTIVLTKAGSLYSIVGTEDAQAWVVFFKDVVTPRAGEFQVQVRITPISPADLPPPPQGERLDGNAYQIQAVYATSGQPVRLRQPITVMLRYPIHATEIVRVSGSNWVALPTTKVEATLQLFGPTTELGVFAAASR